MKFEEITEILDSHDDDSRKRGAVKDFLRERLEEHASAPRNGEQIAYEIAGLLANQYVTSIENTDPIVIALDIASRLELPEPLQRGATWEGLQNAVESIE